MFLRSEPEPIAVQLEGTTDIPKMLIGTSTGLLYCSGSAMYRLTTEEFVYGITRRKDNEWWLAQRGGNFINRIMFDDDMTPTDFELVADLRMAGVAEHSGFHQIDFINDELYICDTYNNRILCGMYTTDYLIIMKVIYPVGWHNLTDSRSRNPKYKHFNSVYRYDVGKTHYVIAHNETHKTKERSQLFLFDDHWKLKAIISDLGSCAHNIVVDFNQRMYSCDSTDSSLLAFDGEKMSSIFKDTRFDTFTRGLAVNDDTIVMGGSQRGGGKNATADGYLFILDSKTSVLKGTMCIPAVGQIFEVRFTGLDYGLSNTWRKHGS